MKLVVFASLYLTIFIPLSWSYEINGFERVVTKVKQRVIDGGDAISTSYNRLQSLEFTTNFAKYCGGGNTHSKIYKAAKRYVNEGSTNGAISVGDQCLNFSDFAVLGIAGKTVKEVSDQIKIHFWLEEAISTRKQSLSGNIASLGRVIKRLERKQSSNETDQLINDSIKQLNQLAHIEWAIENLQRNKPSFWLGEGADDLREKYAEKIARFEMARNQILKDRPILYKMKNALKRQKAFLSEKKGLTPDSAMRRVALDDTHPIIPGSVSLIKDEFLEAAQEQKSESLKRFFALEKLRQHGALKKYNDLSNMTGAGSIKVSLPPR